MSIALLLELIQEGLAALQTLIVVDLEGLVSGLVIGILDDRLARRMVLAEQLDLGSEGFWRHPVQCLDVVLVHAENVVVGGEVLLGDLSRPVRCGDVVAAKYALCSSVRLRTDVPAASACRIPKVFLFQTCFLITQLIKIKLNCIANAIVKRDLIKDWKNSPLFFTKSAKTASPIGDRQMLPRQTNRTPTFFSSPDMTIYTKCKSRKNQNLS